MPKPVTKAIIAAAGFGTRFLPQTKAMPKEMLPLVDKPIIQQIVEELVSVGVTDIVIVTGYHKRTIEDHFDKPSQDLLSSLKNKPKLLSSIKQISEMANFAYIRQKSPYGSGGPLLDAAHLIGNECFIYTFADDFIKAKPIRFKQIIDAKSRYGGSVISCIVKDRPDDYKHYGYVSGKTITGRLTEIDKIVEKPGSRQAAPSSLASVSGFVFDPTILDYLHKQRSIYDSSKEFLVQDAMQAMIKDGHKIYGLEIKNAVYYDSGNPVEYLKTVIDFALERPDIGKEIRNFLKNKQL